MPSSLEPSLIDHFSSATVSAFPARAESQHVGTQGLNLRCSTTKHFSTLFYPRLNFPRHLEQWFSKRGPWVSNVDLNWELVRNINLGTTPQTSETLGQGTAGWILTNSLADSAAPSGLRTMGVIITESSLCSVSRVFSPCDP